MLTALFPFLRPPLCQSPRWPTSATAIMRRTIIGRSSARPCSTVNLRSRVRPIAWNKSRASGGRAYLRVILGPWPRRFCGRSRQRGGGPAASPYPAPSIANSGTVRQSSNSCGVLAKRRKYWQCEGRCVALGLAACNRPCPITPGCANTVRVRRVCALCGPLANKQAHKRSFFSLATRFSAKGSLQFVGNQSAVDYFKLLELDGAHLLIGAR